MVVQFGKDDDRRGSYIAGRSGAKPQEGNVVFSPSFEAGKKERERAQTIQQRGITGLSQDQREQARSIAEQTGKDPYDTKSQIAPGGGIIASKRAPIDKFGDFMTGLIDMGNQPVFGKINFGPILGTVQGFQNTNQVLEKLSKGSELNSKDKITLINLRNNLAGDDFTNLFVKYAEDNDAFLNDMFANFQKEYGKIEESVEDQEDNLQSYFDRMNKMGLGETTKTMAGDLTGTRDTKGITTLEDITDNLGSEGLAYLKATDPQTYYRLRPNDRDLANESFVSTGDPVADRRFNAKIMEARAEAMNRQSRQDANMAQASPAFAPPTAPAPGTPAPPPPIFPGFPGTPTPGLPPGIPTIPTTTVATNYSNMPTYTQGGVQTFLTDPRFAQFRDTLNLFPRV